MLKVQEEMKDTTETLGLPDIPEGTMARVRQLPSDQHLSSRLRELGIYENTTLRFVGHSYGSILFDVHRSRFGLSKAAAQSVLVSIDSEAGQ